MKKIKIRISGQTDRKLLFIKLINEFTNLGLKKSKELTDQIPQKKYIEIDVDSELYTKAVEDFKQIGLDVNINYRENKLKRILYKDQNILFKDLLTDVSNWQTLDTLSDEDKNGLTYNQYREKSIEKIYEKYSGYIDNDNFNILYEEIKNINEMEVKSTDVKILKFNEEFGEFVAEYIKFKGYSYKPYDKEHLLEEMSDTLQCLLSIFASIEKETNITLNDVLLKMFVKNKKWIDKISEYKINN